MVSSLYRYDITALNSSGVAILLTYGNVNDWWLSHPQVINTEGFIQVYYKILNRYFYYINLYAGYWQGYSIWYFQDFSFR